MALNHGWSYRQQIGPDAAGRTVAAHLASSYPHSSLEVWRSRIADGEVELDGHRAGADAPLRAGQVLVWHRPPWDEPEVPSGCDVLYEDEAVLAVAKPSGLPTMPAGGFLEQTLLARLRARYPEASPVHRLGRFTSGVVLCARTSEAAAALGRAWPSQTVHKAYRALVEGRPDWSRRLVRAPIGPVPHPRLGRVHAAREDGRRAESLLVVLEQRDDTAVCEVTISTGRPHQIRIHAAWAGHPLAGDPLYVTGGTPRLADPGLPGDGGYLLHAHRLRFAHPSSGRPMTIVAPVPMPLRTSHDS